MPRTLVFSAGYSALQQCVVLWWRKLSRNLPCYACKDDRFNVVYTFRPIQSMLWPQVHMYMIARPLKGAFHNAARGQVWGVGETPECAFLRTPHDESEANWRGEATKLSDTPSTTAFSKELGIQIPEVSKIKDPLLGTTRKGSRWWAKKAATSGPSPPPSSPRQRFIDPSFLGVRSHFTSEYCLT